MNISNQPDKELEDRLASRLLDVLIRAGLILAMVMLCYRIFSPFLTLMLWALILAVTIYPLHKILANKMGGKQDLTATLLVLVGLVLLVAPTVVLMSSLGDSVHTLVNDIQTSSLQIPAPRANVEKWPLVGKKLYGFWSKAHQDLPALIQSHQPKIGDLTKTALGFVAGIGGGLLGFMASFIVAGIVDWRKSTSRCTLNNPLANLNFHGAILSSPEVVRCDVWGGKSQKIDGNPRLGFHRFSGYLTTALLTFRLSRCRWA